MLEAAATALNIKGQIKVSSQIPILDFLIMLYHIQSYTGRRGASNRPHHGRSPQTAAGKDDSCSTAQKRIRNLQQKVNCLFI